MREVTVNTTVGGKNRNMWTYTCTCLHFWKNPCLYDIQSGLLVIHYKASPSEANKECIEW